MPNRTTYIIQGVGVAIAGVGILLTLRNPWATALLLSGAVAFFAGHLLRKYKGL